MARRWFKGNSHSENGWPYVDEGSCTWVEVVPGVWLQFQNGAPLTLLTAFARDFDAHVEPLRDHDSAAWTQDNTVSTSNHPGGTACDLNWNGADGNTFRLGIPMHVAYPGDKARKLEELLDFYEDFVFCGGYWSIQDWMHFQVGYNTYDQANDRPHQRVHDFIARKIRADGYSTFGRGDAPAGPDPADVLARATGLSHQRAAEILPTMRDGLIAADCTNVNRIAMFIAQTGHESDGFNATEEYASGADYEGRCSDLGNCQPGDGVRFKGRSWIQVTGRHNYTEFSKWAHGKGLVPSPTHFVDNPHELAELRWAGTGAAWYWTVARSDINALSDKQDVYTVTRRINGGTNGLADRRARFNRALALGDQLLTLIGEADPLADPVIIKKINEIHACLFNKTESWSPLATPGEGPRWQLHEKIHSIDGMLHPIHAKARAIAGDLGELHRIVEAANGRGKVTDAVTVRVFQNILKDIEKENPDVLRHYIELRGAA